MINVVVTKSQHRSKDRTFLLAVAPTGHILARKMLGSTLTADAIIDRVREFTAYWTAQPYRSLVSPCIVVRCDSVLL